MNIWFFFISDADPNNYMSYYKRATVFLALGRSRPALADLDKVIQIKNDFLSVSKLNIYLSLKWWGIFWKFICTKNHILGKSSTRKCTYQNGSIGWSSHRIRKSFGQRPQTWSWSGNKVKYTNLAIFFTLNDKVNKRTLTYELDRKIPFRIRKKC